MNSNAKQRAMFFHIKSNLNTRQKESAHTSISRHNPSMPLQKIQPELKKNNTILDYGAGRGKDVTHLKNEGFKVKAFDPNIKGIDKPPKKTDVVLNSYVLNTVRPNERNKIIKDISKKTRKKAYITVRRKGGSGKPTSDGILTKKKTFQKYYTPDELLHYSKRHFKSCVINNKITSPESSSVVCSKS